MSLDRRQIGGQSAKRGTRYEDYFVVARLIEYGPRAFAGEAVRAKEQVDQPVDDLLLLEPGVAHYHQMKSSPEVTWTADDEKLAGEFSEQRRRCVARGEAHRLYLVVAHDHRAERLRQTVPADLGDVEVVRFPILQRPSGLASLREMLGPAFDELRAASRPSRTADEALAQAFFLAYAEHRPDEEGFCVLPGLVEDIWNRYEVPIRRDVRITHPRWPEAVTLLSGIDGLQWQADRGWFEWSYRRFDAGLVGPVDRAPFSRFVDRILESRPESFADFERALP